MIADSARYKPSPDDGVGSDGDITREIKTGEELQNYINSLM